MTNRMASLFAAMLLLAGLEKVQAAPITFTESAVGSGKLGTISFSNASFVITAYADTSQITYLGVFRVGDTSATVSISGVGTATFLIPTHIFDNQFTSKAGINDESQHRDILDTQNPAFETYDLSTSIGPQAGSPTYGFGFKTTSGDFSLTSVSNVTFQAVRTQSVPEPSTLSFTTVGVAGFSGFRRRRR